MKRFVTLAIIGLAAVSLSAGTAFGDDAATTTPAPTTQPVRAYGVYCKAQSHKHVAGTKGTPFSQCVRAMAKKAAAARAAARTAT